MGAQNGVESIEKSHEILMDFIHFNKVLQLIIDRTSEENFEIQTAQKVVLSLDDTIQNFVSKNIIYNK